MELGQRIRDARMAAGLSQKALCGDTITRNMLSLIESGKAKPSMQTLRFLSERLGKPISYFLEEDAILSPNQQLMKQAREAFAENRFKDCLSTLATYAPDGIFDEEKTLLENLSLLHLAQENLQDGRHIYARELLHRMDFTGLYQIPGMKTRQAVLLSKAGEAVPIPIGDEALLEKARQALGREDFQKAAALLNAMEVQDAQWQLLQGQIAVARKEYAAATAYLLSAEAAYPKEVIPLLEQCYRELEDYKMAYAYALKLRGE